MAGKTQYSEDVALFICEQIANGKSLNAIVREHSKQVPAMSTIFKWLGENKAFSEWYALAREVQSHVLADEIIYLSDKAIGDDTIPADKLKLQIDARKWYAGKVKANVYGEPTLMRGRVAKQEEDEYLREMKNVTPADDGKGDIPTDPKKVARIMNYILMKNRKQLEHKEKDE